MSNSSRGRIRALTGAIAVAAALAVAGCGDNDSSTTSAGTSATTEETAATTTEQSTTAASGSGALADATAALEGDGFDVREEPAGDLQAAYGTATAGAVLTRSGSSGDVVVYEWSDAKEAADYAKGETDDIVTTEAVDTLTFTSTTNNTDLLDQALAAIG